MIAPSDPARHHYVPGLTLSGAARGAGSVFLLGGFQVSVLHNIVQFLFGAAGVALARTAKMARRFLIGGGFIYLALWVCGLGVDKVSGASLVPLNSADNWLYMSWAPP